MPGDVFRQTDPNTFTEVRLRLLSEANQLKGTSCNVFLASEWKSGNDNKTTNEKHRLSTQFPVVHYHCTRKHFSATHFSRKSHNVCVENQIIRDTTFDSNGCHLVAQRKS